MHNFHYIITLENPLSRVTCTRSGLLDLEPTCTRAEAYDYVYRVAIEAMGVSKACVTFFSLEPNQLPAVPTAIPSSGFTS